MKNYLSIESRIRRLERKLKYESITLNTLDCRRLKILIESKVKGNDPFVEVNDKKSDYGYLTIQVTTYSDSEEVSNDYRIFVEEFDAFELSTNNKKLGEYETLNEVGLAIANHFNKNFV